MKQAFFTWCLVGCCLVLATAQTQHTNNWQLQWSDEFNSDGLPDSNYWSYAIGGDGWGNNERQYYTAADPQNVQVKDGYLHIIARKQEKEGKQYTSARLVTKNKVDFRYGRIAVRAMLPKGLGLWPAIWMLPSDWTYGEWPQSGEIDIMEHVGFMPDSVFGSVHTERFNHTIGTQKTKGIGIKNPYTDFHVFAIEWNEQYIDFYVDDQQYYRFSNTVKGKEEWPFDQRFHLLLNIAVGGNWGGQKGVDDHVFPATMKIDYVRYYLPK
ncbi:hypothetical protein GCM10023231_41590 [Olivibacter ginsenosidimutans]|uniref:GH16 domain-containing protein n=1 Tax=Olivibacter ginsenosidimutans TaxID=1176537 RepID=A0ABP9CD01_9SPHI